MNAAQHRQHRTIAARLRLAAALAEHQAEQLAFDAREARALAGELESDSPPPLEAVHARGVALFRRSRP